MFVPIWGGIKESLECSPSRNGYLRLRKCLIFRGFGWNLCRISIHYFRIRIPLQKDLLPVIKQADFNLLS